MTDFDVHIVCGIGDRDTSFRSVYSDRAGMPRDSHFSPLFVDLDRPPAAGDLTRAVPGVEGDPLRDCVKRAPRANQRHLDAADIVNPQVAVAMGARQRAGNRLNRRVTGHAIQLHCAHTGDVDGRDAGVDPNAKFRRHVYKNRAGLSSGRGEVDAKHDDVAEIVHRDGRLVGVRARRRFVRSGRRDHQLIRNICACFADDLYLTGDAGQTQCF